MTRRLQPKDLSKYLLFKLSTAQKKPALRMSCSVGFAFLPSDEELTQESDEFKPFFGT